MKKLLLFIFLLSISTLLFCQNLDTNSRAFFYENKGQIVNQHGKENAAVKYLFHSNGLNVQIKKEGFSYDVYEIEKTLKKEKPTKNKTPKQGSKHPKYNYKFKYHRVDIDFVGGNKNPEIIAEGKSSDYDNFYNIPHKPKGVEKVHRYQKIKYKNIYSNIDLVFFKPEDTLKPIEYNFIINPGGKISDIRLKFKGAKTRLKDGKLSMKLRFGEMQENIPHSWEEDKNAKNTIDVRFKDLGNEIFGFSSVKDISDKVVVIDPVPTKVWVTDSPTLTSHGVGYSVSANKDNYVYTGSITSATYNVATNTYNEFDYGSVDISKVSKFDPNGNLLWKTYIGNYPVSDEINGFGAMKINKLDDLYIVGNSRDNYNGLTTITTPGAHKEHSTGGGIYNDARGVDGFIMKLGSNGTRIWGTYFGGDEYDRINTIDLDSQENIVIAGITNSSEGIITNDAIEKNPKGGFVAKFDSTGKQLYGTYFQNIITFCTVDQNDNIIIGGEQSYYPNYVNISTPNAFQNQIVGRINVYVAKLNLNYSIKWATYFGGIDGFDDNRGTINYIKGLTTDQFNNIYFSGLTNSIANISTPNSHQQYNSAGRKLAYLTKFDPNGNQLWGTYFGGYEILNVQNPILVESLTVNEKNEIFLSGETIYKTDIATSNGYLQYSLYNSGFFTKFDDSGKQIWGSYKERNVSSIYSLNGYIYTFELFSLRNNLTKFYDCTTAVQATSDSSVCVGSTIKLKASGGSTYSWSGPNGFTSTLQNPTIPNATILNTGIYSCIISGTGGCDGTFTVEVKVEDKTAPIPNISNLPTITGNCKTMVTIIPTATDNCMGTIVGTTSDPLQYSLSGNYVIHWKYDDGNGNISTQNQNITIISEPLPTANFPQNFCKINNPKISDIQIISGTDIKWYNSAGTPLNTNTILVDGTKYYATQTLSGCESAKLEILANVNDPNPPTGNALQDFCSAQNPTISNIVVNGQNIKWFDATGAVLATSTLLSDGKTYYASQTLNDCESTQKLAITVSITNGGIPANDYKTDICNDTTANFKKENLNNYKENLVTDSAIYIFEFFDANNQLVPDDTNANLNIGSNIFNVKISNNLGCFVEAKLTLTLNPKPILNLPQTAEFCNGLSVELDAGFNPDYNYEWSNGKKTHNIIVDKEGTYSVKATTKFGCENTASTVVKKSILADILKVEIQNNNAKIILSVNGDFEYSLDNVIWQNSNVFNNLPNGNHTVFVKTKLGCIIGSMNFSIFNVSNIFTPNADGINDTWKLSGLENYPNSEIQIFDRFGNLVFQKITNGTFEWDGTFNSRKLPTGNYWYVIKVSDGRLLNGWLALKNRN